MQQYHKLRRDVERQVSRFGALSDPSQFRNSKFLQRALQSHDTFRVAQGAAGGCGQRREGGCGAAGDDGEAAADGGSGGGAGGGDEG